VAQIGSAIGREFSHALLASVARKPEAELGSALDRLVQAGLLSRQGVPPQASYLFKHALVQDAAYGTLLREPRRGLHARIAETLENQFAETAESQPDILALHCTEAGLIEKAAGLWGKAGQRSLAHSALVEAAAQFTRALGQIATLPGTAALRRASGRAHHPTLARGTDGLQTLCWGGTGFEPVWGFSYQVVFCFVGGSLFGAGKSFFVL
jgi:predicted ATPase